MNSNESYREVSIPMYLHVAAFAPKLAINRHLKLSIPQILEQAHKLVAIAWLQSFN